MRMPRDTPVLVVDDEDTIRGLIVQVLEDEGYEIREASNAEEALQLFRAKPFPLIVTDIYMGKMTGLDLLKEVKTLDGNSMVVVMTSNASLETATEALRASVGYAFGNLSPARLLAWTDAQNVAMHRVLEHTGFESLGDRPCWDDDASLPCFVRRAPIR